MRAADVLWLATVLFASRPAGAWVCARALDNNGKEANTSLSWSTRDLSYAFHINGTAKMDGGDEFDVLEAAFATWVGISDCSAGSVATDITFSRDQGFVDRDLVGYDFFNPDDNENLLIFRDSGWPHATSVIALTTTTYGTRSGEIIDADIEFNSQHFDFADLPACCPDCDGLPGNDPDDQCRYMDLSNTAVHEIGHVLGLGHPDDWSDIDPDCSTDATMCSTAALGTTDKRTLACDDRNAIVFKYPAGQPNRYCDEQPSCADGQEACGSCSAVACAEWSACGFCAAPPGLTTSVRVITKGIDADSGGGCGCGGPNGTGGVALAMAALLLRRGRCRRDQT